MAQGLLCRDPATGELLGEAPVQGSREIADAVAAAREVQRTWKATPWQRRARLASTLLEFVLGSQPELCRLVGHDIGKTMRWTLLEELTPTAQRLDFLASREARPGRRRSLPPTMRHRDFLIHDIIGIAVGHRTPLFDTLAVGCTALVAGNAVILKADPLATWCANAFAQLVREVLVSAGHPSTLFQLITGDDDTARLLESAGLDSFVNAASPGVHGRSPILDWTTVTDAPPPPSAKLRELLAPLGGPRRCRFFIPERFMQAWLGALEPAIAGLERGRPTETETAVGVPPCARNARRCRAAIAASVDRGARRVNGEEEAVPLLAIRDPDDPIVSAHLDCPVVLAVAVGSTAKAKARVRPWLDFAGSDPFEALEARIQARFSPGLLPRARATAALLRGLWPGYRRE